MEQAIKLITNGHFEGGGFSDRNLFQLMNRWDGEGILRLATGYFRGGGPVGPGEILENYSDRGTGVRIITEFDGAPEQINLINSVIDRDNLSIQVFTKEKFHPKFYVFGEEFVVVGSSNFTYGGLAKNNETNVILSDGSTVGKFIRLFEEYHREAKPLAEDVFSGIKKGLAPLIGEDEELEERISEKRKKRRELIEDQLGRVGYPTNEMSEKTCLEKQREYERFIEWFEVLRQFYQRVVNEEGDSRFKEGVPLRIEIDGFLSWLYQQKKLSRLDTDEATRHEQTGEMLGEQIKGYLQKPESVDEDRIQTFETFRELFNTEENVRSIEKKDLRELERLYSIRVTGSDQRSPEEIVAEIIENNELDRVRDLFAYLFFGPEPDTKRVVKVAEPTLSPSLDGMGPARIKELYGWANQEDIPIWNNRVNKTMKWIGNESLTENSDCKE